MDWTFETRFPKGTKESWQTAGHNEGTAAQPCEECGCLVAAEFGHDLRHEHSEWHDRQAHP